MFGWRRATRRVLLPLVAAVGLLAVWSLVAGGVAAEAATTPCDRADELRRQGQLGAALVAYARVEQRGSPPCSRRGIDLVLERRGAASELAQRGKALEDAKLSLLARSDYTEALLLDPENADAKAGLLRLDKPAAQAKDPFAAAQALADAGFYDEARKALAKALESGTAGDVPDDLEFLSPKPPGRAGEKREAWKPRLELLGWMFLVLIVALAIGFAIVRLVRALAGGWRLLRINDFESTSIDPDVGKGVRSIVQHEAGTLGPPAGGNRLSIVQGTTTPQELLPAAVKELSTPLKVGVAVLEWIIPRRESTLYGTLMPAGKNGAGLTLSITGPSARLGNSMTLWADSYDPFPKPPTAKDPMQYYKLALLGAAWVRYHAPRSIWSRTPFSALGTSDWESFALYRAGVDWQLAGDDLRARVMYVRALARDRGNGGAAFNLAVMNARDVESPLSMIRAMASLAGIADGLKQ